jgi:excisionase family DNA binding protein
VETTEGSAQNNSRRWYSVAEVARMLGMAPMTVYRAIHSGEFPAVKIRGRYVIPTRALEELEQAAVRTQGLVMSADVVPADGTAWAAAHFPDR